MSLISPTRLRWKTIVLSFVFVYAFYFLGGLDNIEDRREILEKIQSINEGAPESSRTGFERLKDVSAASAASATLTAEVVEPTQSTTISIGPMEPPVLPDVTEYIAFCVAVKNQRRDLPEFLRHHYYNMGVGRFYIMDDGSIPPLSTFSSEYGVPRSVLTFDYKPFGNRTVKYMQYALDDRCIKKHGKNHTWMAFIDADEFIETRKNHTLVGILKNLDKQKDVGALAINWRIHTSAGLLTRPESSRKGFTQCIGDEDADDNTHWMDNKGIKSIVKVKSYKLPMNPHHFYLKKNQVTVGEHGDIVPYGARRTPISRDIIGLHHYAIKSRGEFEEKMTRWSAKGWDYWVHIERFRVLHECHEMARYEI